MGRLQVKIGRTLAMMMLELVEHDAACPALENQPVMRQPLQVVVQQMGQYLPTPSSLFVMNV
jgi:hypothetical protein